MLAIIKGVLQAMFGIAVMVTIIPILAKGIRMFMNLIEPLWRWGFQ